MPRLWDSPLYKFTTPTGKRVTIDVTKSVSAGLPPHRVIAKLIPFFESRGVQSLLDFGSGALRHTLPLLEAGFEVCAVDFEEILRLPMCEAAYSVASGNSNFSALIWPRDFIRATRKFDAALVSYVIQTMPKPSERKRALDEIAKKLRKNGYLLYMSRFNQWQPDDSLHEVSDGVYRNPGDEMHSFYREFTPDETHEMMDQRGLKRIKSLGEGGKEQVFLYTKGDGTWI